MAEIKTPGVYVVEKNAFPNSVVEVATAVPVFIGFTEKAMSGNKSLRNVPTRIESMREYRQLFGDDPVPAYALDIAKTPDVQDASPFAPNGATRRDIRPTVDMGLFEGKQYALRLVTEGYLLPHAMRFFFQNGGGTCYVVSVGGFTDPITLEALEDAIDLLKKETEPTMVLAPDALRLSRAQHATMNRALLAHCAAMQDRIAILDVFGGWRAQVDPIGDPILAFREDVGTEHLHNGAAYYPWMHTSLDTAETFNFQNIVYGKPGLLVDFLSNGITDQAILDEIGKLNQDFGSGDAARTEIVTLDKTLRAVAPRYKALMEGVAELRNLLPPGPAMAGIYTAVDNSRGVWKAPANISVNSVIGPSTTIDSDENEDLNTPVNGKAVNAIRIFPGQGTLVWGARTLDGNSQDWRYINVRRTMIMIEESIKLTAQHYVFSPNDASTWVTLKSALENFLTNLWKQGALAGASPDDAFNVEIGLGSTMTAQDILEGVMKIQVQVAITRPAEFMVISIQQQMQKG